ncbi:fibronectin type III domain-containing protein [Sporocytophaga myxococcoides]|uniref:Fibronectin type III domain-containing protein n=1 Tax=Sporocytophaga myxococcoides TaxID=153721 RepID=A0A098LJM5_9BACT|nr:T9SS type A sorting domain-containing protein [Sporocytophaga myxococcoides]GAL86627.1 fibronectin type III domain-containing protein [Sporocytophaga myxococcoides]
MKKRRWWCQLLLTGLISFGSVSVKADSNVPCGSGTSQTIVLGTNCQNCSVLQPSLAVDDDTNSFSTIKLAPDIHYGYVAQRIKFSSAGSKKDQIKIKLSFSDPVYDRNLISNIFISTVVGNNINTERVNFNDNDVKLFWSSLQDVIVIFNPDENFQGVEVYLKAENNNKVRTVHLHYATVLLAAPVVQKEQVTTCQGQPAVLHATKPVGATFKWYSQKSGGLPVYTGADFTTPAITSETTYYVEAVYNGCSTSKRTPVIIKTTPLPEKPTVSNSMICSGQSATLVASVYQPSILNWYDQASGGNVIASGTSFSTPPLYTSTIYYVEASKSGCVSGRVPAQVNIQKKISKVWDNTVSNTINNITRSNDSAYILAGYIYASGNTYFRKTKTDLAGNVISTEQTFLRNGPITNFITQNLSDKGYIFAGTQNIPYNLLVYKIDQSGNISWSLDIPANGHQNGISSVIENNDGTLLLAGYTSNTNGKQFDFWILKVDYNGNILWTKTYGGPKEEILISAIAVPDGGYALGGYAIGDTSQRAWLVRINDSGDILWDKIYSKSYMDQIQSLILTPEEGFLLYAMDYEHTDHWIIKTDSLGNVIWNKIYGGSNFDYPVTVIPAYGGGYIAGGYTRSSNGDISDGNNGDDDLWIYKIDDAGNKIWDITLGGSSSDRLSSLFNNNDGSYLLGAYSFSGPNDGDVTHGPGDWLVKIVESNGNCAAREAKENVAEVNTVSYKTTAYPNPFNSNINLDITANEAGNLHLQLFSIEGILLKDIQQYVGSGQGTVSLKTDEMPAGTYIVKMMLNNQVVTEKLIKNN